MHARAQSPAHSSTQSLPRFCAGRLHRLRGEGCGQRQDVQAQDLAPVGHGRRLRGLWLAALPLHRRQHGRRRCREPSKATRRHTHSFSRPLPHPPSNFHLAYTLPVRTPLTLPRRAWSDLPSRRYFPSTCSSSSPRAVNSSQATRPRCTRSPCRPLYTPSAHAPAASTARGTSCRTIAPHPSIIQVSSRLHPRCILVCALH